MRMQARYMRMHEHRQRVFFDILNQLLIKIHPKHVPTPPKVLGFHLNPSHNKTQAFSSPKIDLNGRSKENEKKK